MKQMDNIKYKFCKFCGQWYESFLEHGCCIQPESPDDLPPEISKLREEMLGIISLLEEVVELLRESREKK